MLKIFMCDTVHMFLTYSLTYITGNIVYIFLDSTVFCVACVTLQDITHVALAILVFLCTEHWKAWNKLSSLCSVFKHITLNIIVLGLTCTFCSSPVCMLCFCLFWSNEWTLSFVSNFGRGSSHININNAWKEL
jgi:hypothetical protein